MDCTNADPVKCDLISRIRLYHVQGDYISSARSIDQFLALYPDDWWGYYCQGQVLFNTKQYKKALHILNKAHSLAPEETQVLVELSNTLRKLKKINESYNVNLMLIEILPSNSEWYIRAADDLIVLKRLDEALNLVESGLQAVPVQINLLIAASNICRSMKKREDSLFYCNNICSAYPENPIGYIRSVEDCLILGQDDQALDIIHSGLGKINENHVERLLGVYLQILTFWYRKGDFIRVRDQSLYLKETYSQHWHGYIAEINANLRLGLYDTAELLIRQAELLFPGSQHVLNMQAVLEDHTGKPNSSVTNANEYIRRAMSKSTPRPEDLCPDRSQLKFEVAKLFHTQRNSYYTDLFGVSNFIPPQHTKVYEVITGVVFDILAACNVQFFLFAGTLVGYQRNKKPPAWVDDVDLILFEDQELVFRTQVIPLLEVMGFQVTLNRRNGGYHIFVQHPTRRFYYSKSEIGKMRRYQLDIFISHEDCLGYLRNRNGWGLYTRKDVPIQWVRPAKTIPLFDRQVPVFRHYELDIMLEYGDVMNNVVVSSHFGSGITYLNLPSVAWHDFEEEFNALYEMLPPKLPPSCHAKNVNEYAPRLGVSIDDRNLHSFDDICERIIEVNPSVLHLANPSHYFWCMDIKRIFPALLIHIHCQPDSVPPAIPLLCNFYDEITSPSESLRSSILERLRLVRDVSRA